ncbi:MAG: sporulation transcriptional regulator SpoIIID [Clostridia bacterium]|nr:sporulation transcriptional regulator SpoIIID [Clostridia bacterium]
MKEYIELRTLQIAEYILKTKATIRETSTVFCVSKSTVHKDLSQRLPRIDHEKYLRVKKILDFNLSERHIRGGISTQMKYVNSAKKKN